MNESKRCFKHSPDELVTRGIELFLSRCIPIALPRTEWIIYYTYSIIPTWLISRVCPIRVLDSNHSRYGNWIQAEEVDHVSGNQHEMTFETSSLKSRGFNLVSDFWRNLGLEKGSWHTRGICHTIERQNQHRERAAVEHIGKTIPMTWRC